jgi:signal peptidase I
LNRVKSISENLLNTGYDFRINTLGLSMFPLIKTGDKITMSAESNLYTGDIIVFERGDRMVCHRLVKVFEIDGIRYYQTRGDSHFDLDNPLTADQILGKVVRIERENVSLPRRILLFIYPLLGVGRLNALVITVLMRVRKLLAFKKS